MPSKVSGRCVAGPSATTQNGMESPRLSRVFIKTLIPAEPRNSTFNKSMIRPFGFLASAESMASVSPGAVSMSTLPLTDYHCQTLDLRLMGAEVVFVGLRWRTRCSVLVFGHHRSLIPYGHCVGY